MPPHFFEAVPLERKSLSVAKLARGVRRRVGNRAECGRVSVRSAEPTRIALSCDAAQPRSRSRAAETKSTFASAPAKAVRGRGLVYAGGCALSRRGSSTARCRRASEAGRDSSRGPARCTSARTRRRDTAGCTWLAGLRRRRSWGRRSGTGLRRRWVRCTKRTSALPSTSGSPKRPSRIRRAKRTPAAPHRRPRRRISHPSKRRR